MPEELVVLKDTAASQLFVYYYVQVCNACGQRLSTHNSDAFGYCYLDRKTYTKY